MTSYGPDSKGKTAWNGWDLLCLKTHRLHKRLQQCGSHSHALRPTDRSPKGSQGWLSIAEPLTQEKPSGLCCYHGEGHCSSSGGKEYTVKSVRKGILRPVQWALIPDFYSWLFYYSAMRLGNLLTLWTSASSSVKLKRWTR